MFGFLANELATNRNARRSLHSLRSSVAADFGHAESLEARTLLSAGDLDPSFGVGGKVTTEFREGTTTSVVARATALQADGKVVAVGDGGIARYMPNGSPDLTFGVGARVEYPYAARSVAIQSDGKIVVGGGIGQYTSDDFVVSRYLSNGTLDTTFDGDGHILTDFGNIGEVVRDVAIQANGRIIAVGYSNDSIAIARYTTTGVLDTTFDGDGRFLRRFGTHRSDAANAVALQADGRIVVTGISHVDSSFNFTNYDFFVMRLNSGGSLDRTFGSVGFVNMNFGYASYSYDEARNVAIQSDGRIVVTGLSQSSFRSYVAVSRYNTDGSPDTGFSQWGYKLLPTSTVTNGQNPGGEIAIVLPDGKLLTSTNGWIHRINTDGSDDTAFSVGGELKSALLQPDGKLVVSGTFQGWFGVVRTDAAGVKDSTFSADGIAVTDFGPAHDEAGGATLQSDGRIVVVGTSERSFAVARYSSTGRLDTTFSLDGRSIINFGDDVFTAFATDVAIQPDGKTVIVGTVIRIENQSSIAQLAVVRLNPDGSLDTTFGGTGKVLTDVGGYGGANSVALQSDGRIVVGGFGSGGYFTIVRYLPNGTLDSSFSGDGKQSLVSGYYGSRINDLAILPDGRILAVGDYYTATGSWPMMIRLMPNGAYDRSFGTNGRRIDSTGSQRTANEVAILSDGSFLVAGNSTEKVNGSETNKMAVSKYDIGGNGRFFTAVETVIYASDSTPFEQPQTGSLLRSMIVQPDGKIVLAGSSYAGVTLIRLNSSGERDTSFNGDGRATALIGPASNPYQDYRGADLLYQPDGRLLVVGSLQTFGSSRPNNKDFALARFQNPAETATSTTVSLNATGNIEIKDLWGRDDQLELRVLGGELWVTDLTLDSRAVFTVTGLPTITGNGTKQIRIPVSLIAAIGKPLIFNMMAGDDSLIQFGFESAFDSTGLRFLGGLGRDRMSFENYNTPSVWNISAGGNGQVTPTGRGTRFFNSVEAFRGGAGADEFRLTAGTVATLVRVDGGDGADRIRMAGDADMLLTNGLLTVSGPISERVAIRNVEQATLVGGSGSNVLDATAFSGSVTLVGEDGDDTLFGSQLDDLLVGGPGNDLLVGYYGNDRLYGDAGNDILVGGGGADVLRGGGGEDLLIGGHSLHFDHYANAADRDALFIAWIASESYADRVNRLLNTGVTGVNGLVKLTPANTVFEDGIVDTFFGEDGFDWFFAATTGGNSEVGLTSGGLRDLGLDEILTPLT